MGLIYVTYPTSYSFTSFFSDVNFTIDHIDYVNRIGNWSCEPYNVHMHSVLYRTAGDFRWVLIFVILVVNSAVTKISTHEN